MAVVSAAADALRPLRVLLYEVAVTAERIARAILEAHDTQASKADRDGRSE